MIVKISKSDLKTLELVSNAVGDKTLGSIKPVMMNVNVENGLIVGCDGHILRVEKLDSLEGISGQITLGSIKSAKAIARKAKHLNEVDLEILQGADLQHLDNYPEWRNCVCVRDAFTEECNPWFLVDVMAKLLTTLPKDYCKIKFMAQKNGLKKAVLVSIVYNGKCGK
jgi:hypothetical protein